MAQDRKAEPQSNRNITPISEDVTIIVQQRQARFTAQKAIEQVQLQVFDQWGEVVFDSGPVIANEINWPFQNATGETIKSGLYAYALSIKETGLVVEPKVRSLALRTRYGLRRGKHPSQATLG
jgi:hypothetical protein